MIASAERGAGDVISPRDGWWRATTGEGEAGAEDRRERLDREPLGRDDGVVAELVVVFEAGDVPRGFLGA
jgi:hypothetical protein